MGTYVHRFNFSDSGNYVTSGDCSISEGTLSVGTSVLIMNNVTRKWGYEFNVDGEYNMVPAVGTIYLSLNGSSNVAGNLVLTDASLSLFAKFNANLTLNSQLRLFTRYDDVSGDGLDSLIVGLPTGKPQYRFLTADDLLTFVDLGLQYDFISIEWRAIILTAIGSSFCFQLGAQRDYIHRHVDTFGPGVFAIETTQNGGSWVFGGDSGEDGHPSPKPCPWIAVRRQGACELATSAGFVLPAGCTGLESLSVCMAKQWMHPYYAQPSAGTDFEFVAKSQYRLNDGPWTLVPDHGGLGGIGTAGDTFWWRIDDGNGTGLDTGMGDHLLADQQFTWAPIITSVHLHYYADSISTGVSTFRQRDAAGFRRRG